MSDNMLHHPLLMTALLEDALGAGIIIELPEQKWKCTRKRCNNTATKNRAYCSVECCKADRKKEEVINV